MPLGDIVLDKILNHPRERSFRYFVRGDVKPPWDRQIPTDFGDGIYAWEDSKEGLQSALDWAYRKSDLSDASAVPVVQLLRVVDSAFDKANCRRLREAGSDWEAAVQWYRQRGAAQEDGPLADYDVVSGPQAVRPNRRWVPALDLQDQFRFLGRFAPHVELILEIELV